MQRQFAITLIGVTISDIDPSAIDLDRADQHSAGTNFVCIQVRIGLYSIERFEGQAIGVMRTHQKIAEVSGIMRVRQIDTRRRANVPDKRAQPGKRAGNRMRLVEENGMLARIWRQSCYLAGTLSKIMRIGGIYRQPHLAVMIEDDSVSFFKTKGIHHRSTLGTANTALTRSLHAAGRPRRSAHWTFLIHKCVIADLRALYGHRARYLVSAPKIRRNHRPPAAGRHNATNASAILDGCRKTQARPNQPAGILVYKYLVLDVRRLHKQKLLSQNKENLPQMPLLF